MKHRNVNLKLDYNEQIHIIQKRKRFKLEEFIALFDDYLENQKNFSRKHCHYVCNISRLFLLNRFGSQAVHLSQIKINDVISFIDGYARHESPDRTRNMTSALRSFFRFLKFKDMTAIDFSIVVPSVAIWKMDRIPNFLSDQEITELLNHCDKSKAIGLRDYTILRLILGLGLRACEISRLTLEDFDWRNGELLIHGKGLKISRLPLMQDLGDDLTTYLIKGRPSCSSRNFFISIRKPFHGLKTRSIFYIVEKALKVAGIKKKGKTHLLRHTLATRLLNHGASLQEVGEVLRHQSINTTSIYAKVDFNRLRSLALPWPGNLRFGDTL